MPKALLIHGYGTNITSFYSKPRGESGGFDAFMPLIKNDTAKVFFWDIPFVFPFPQSLNPFNQLKVYLAEKKQLSDPELYNRVVTEIQKNNITTLIGHSMGCKLMYELLQREMLPQQITHIITIQADLPVYLKLAQTTKQRLKSKDLIWHNYWCWWDVTLMLGGVLHGFVRGGLIGIRNKHIKNYFYPLYKDPNVHISSIVDPEFVKRLKL